MSLGTSLRTLREQKGLSIEELSERTHVSSSIIEDFENDKFERITAAIYGSGFVKILAKALGADAEPLRTLFMDEYKAYVDSRTGGAPSAVKPQKFGESRSIAFTESEKASSEVPPKKDVRSRTEAPVPKKKSVKSETVPTPAIPVKAPEIKRVEPKKSSIDVETPAPAAIEDSFGGEEPDALGELFASGGSEEMKVESASPPQKVKVPRSNGQATRVNVEREHTVSVFHDVLAKKKSFDFSAVLKKAKEFLAVLPLKTVGIVAGIVVITIGLCLLFVNNGPSDDVEKNDVTIQSKHLPKVEDEAQSLIEGSVLNDYLLPIPDSYVE